MKSLFKSIYELELHETLEFEVNSGHLSVTRVPGGWIYEKRVPGVSVSITFVPFNNEFNINT